MPRKPTRIPDEENTLLNNILEYAQYRHVMAMHPRPARTEQGWRTAIQGDEGFFDLTLIGDGGIILAELKRRKGAVHTDAQKAWERTARAAARHFDQDRFVVALWTFDNWPHDIKAAIDSIAKPSPVHRTAAQARTGEPLATGGLLREPPPRPSSPPAPPPVASGASSIPVVLYVDGQPFGDQINIRRNDDAPGMRMAANVRDEIMRLRRLRNS